MSSHAPHEAGCLYVVATPIGHRDDLSARAIATLKRADRIACEDTRHSAPLLASIGASAPAVALHEHNEAQASAKLVERMLGGEQIALISDAGTPLVSDPGYRLVQAAIAAGVRVVPIPGPSAPIAALSVSGLPSDRFSFEGFLPVKSGARREVFTRLVEATQTLIFFEAKHRIVESLACDCLDHIAAVIPSVLHLLNHRITRHRCSGGIIGVCFRSVKASEDLAGPTHLIVLGLGEYPIPSGHALDFQTAWPVPNLVLEAVSSCSARDRIVKLLIHPA